MVSVQREDFNIQAEIDALVQGHRGIGAVVSFIGLVRDLHSGESLTNMTLEHYPGMTEKALVEIEAQARIRWELTGVTIIHRVGLLAPCEQIVLVVTASAHRQAAFESAAFIMDYLKSRAPFWKKETLSSGQAQWVDAKETDEQAICRWQNT